MEGQSKHLTLDSIAEEISPHASWIERKSYMLDEVDQLMDLMSAEKTSLLSRITQLEAELKEERDHREGEMEQMEVEKAQWLSLEQQLRQEAEDEAHRWAQVVEAEQTTSRSLREQLSGLEEELVKKNNTIAELESFGQCQVKDLEAKLHVAFAQHKKIKQNLEIQSSENMTLKVELAHMQEKQRVAQNERKHLEAQLQEWQQRCSQQGNEILALRGRLTNSKKACEKLQAQCTQLEAQCTQLEAQSLKVAKVYTRRNEEERLLNECKKKDDLLASCVREASYVRQEQSTLLEQLRNMEAKWKEVEGEKLSLQSELKSHQSTVAEYGQRISHYECREKEFGQVKKEMEKKFQFLDKELSGARSEVMAMQKTLAALEQRHSEERNSHQAEQRGTQTLLKESKEMITWLNSQLERERLEHASAIEMMAQQWQEEMKKAVEDYGRMKEAGARRCAQLAKDLWDLKSKLDTT